MTNNSNTVAAKARTGPVVNSANLASNRPAEKTLSNDRPTLTDVT